MTPASEEPTGDWGELRRRRRRFWQVVLSFFVLPVVLLPFGAMVNSHRAGPINTAAVLVFVAVMFTWLAAYLVAFFRLLRWPCPRCGKPFLWSWWNTWPYASSCRNCDLPVGTEAKSDLTRALDRIVSEYQGRPWFYWLETIERGAIKFEQRDSKGKRYQVEIQAFWDDVSHSKIKVAIAIDRSWWRTPFTRMKYFTVRTDRAVVVQ